MKLQKYDAGFQRTTKKRRKRRGSLSGSRKIEGGGRVKLNSYALWRSQKKAWLDRQAEREVATSLVLLGRGLVEMQDCRCRQVNGSLPLAPFRVCDSQFKLRPMLSGRHETSKKKRKKWRVEKILAKASKQMEKRTKGKRKKIAVVKWLLRETLTSSKEAGRNPDRWPRRRPEDGWDGGTWYTQTLLSHGWALKIS